jgi:hypothetical protein
METMANLVPGDRVFVTMSIQDSTDTKSNMLSYGLVPSIIYTGQWISTI